MSNDSLPTNQPNTSNKSFNPILIVAGILMICAIGFLVYSNSSKDRVIDQTVAELEETEALRVELETQFNESISELEDMRTSNDEMNALIDAQKDELEDQRSKIAGLIGNKTKLDAARREMKNMKAQTKEYLVRIEQLQADNELLAATNLQLDNDKTVLNSELEVQRTENQVLNENKAKLVSEKTELSQKNDALSATVNLASVIKVEGIKIDGFKRKDDGKTKRKKAAKSVDEIKVCFNTSENEVAKSGNETFLVRIMSPLGETLYMEDLGSGVSKNLSTDEAFRFSKSVEAEYANTTENVCVRWMPETGFQAGKYQVEIFNKGHLAGTQSFELK
ncbi:MAG: hypothetical protein ACI9XO_003696 [Paraglaciecola sp.]|jgi:CHASE3 domain sensor protein